MYYKKQGLPEEGDIVICTVKKILFHSIFAKIDEYDNLEGMIHISEIAPGRIRNIRDYVREGKMIVCKILRINKQKGHIDLSLRRVALSAKKNKLEEFKQEGKSEKIIEALAQKTKVKVDVLYKEFVNDIIQEFGGLYPAFQKIVIQENEDVLKKIKIKKEHKDLLITLIKERIKPPEVLIKTNMQLTCSKPDGVERIRKAIKAASDIIKKEKYEAVILYIGAPKYQIQVKATDFPEAQNITEEITAKIIHTLSDEDGEALVLKK